MKHGRYSIHIYWMNKWESQPIKSLLEAVYLTGSRASKYLTNMSTKMVLKLARIP